MHIVVTVFALVILATGIFYGQKVADINNNSDREESREVLSIAGEDVDDIKGIEGTKKEEENITAIPKHTVTKETSTPQPTAANVNSDIQLQTYKYPDSTVTNSSSNSLNLQSDASSKSITDWYKETINGNGFNVTSFVVTSTNDNVLNKLAAAKNGQNIEVEIEKKSNESKTFIKVTLF